ncbi:MAG: hypothetical protein NVS9B4_04540 [Candidatus Acidiferrum sp.]
MVRAAWLVVFLLLGVVTAQADQVALKNGDRLTGTIIKSDKQNLVMKTEFAGDVNLQWGAITEITSSQQLFVALKSGKIAAGQITTVDGKFDVATPDEGLVVASKDDVVAVRSSAEEKIYDQTRHPRLVDFWGGLLDTGLTATRGNSNSTSFSLTGKAARTTPRDKLGFYANAIYTKSEVSGVNIPTAHAVRGGLRDDLNITEHWFAFVFTDFEYDQFQGLNLRNVLGGGLGSHLVKTPRTTFDVFSGGTFNQEYYSQPFNPPSLARQRKSGEVDLGETLVTKLGVRTTLSEQFSFYPNVTDPGRFRFQFDTTAATKLKSWLAWQITYSDRYVSAPLTGLKNNDELLSAGIRLTLGKGVF